MQNIDYKTLMLCYETHVSIKTTTAMPLDDLITLEPNFEHRTVLEHMLPVPLARLKT